MAISGIPASGRVSSTYGNRTAPTAGASTNHKGVDIAAPKGTPVSAPAEGTVTFAGTQRGYGNVVYVKHEDGTETRYAHLDKINVKKGETLNQGQQLGTVGNSGVSSGAHLHYEIRDKNGNPIDPATQNAQLGQKNARVVSGTETAGTPTTTTTTTQQTDTGTATNTTVVKKPTETTTSPKTNVPVAAGNTAKRKQLGIEDLQKEASVYKDWRVRLRPIVADAPYDGELLSILSKTDGIVFPYNPASFQLQINNDYSQHSLTFANMDYFAFQRSTMPSISLSGEFTAQTPRQAEYCLAVIHFFKTYTKMRYGVSDPKRGELPPRMLLDAYGEYNIRSLPVYITGYNFDLPETAAYVSVVTGDKESRVPAVFNFNITLQPNIHPSMWNYPGANISAERSQRMFNYDNFATGKLIKYGGWI